MPKAKSSEFQETNEGLNSRRLSFDRLRVLLQSPHYASMQREAGVRERWTNYVRTAEVDELVCSARDLFELIESELDGTITFTPGMKAWIQGIYMVVDIKGVGRKGEILNWNVRGSSELTRRLHRSSDVETEIWQRIVNRGEYPAWTVEVFGRSVGARELRKYFSKYPRNFGSQYNGMPACVESAFNHMPSVDRFLEVRGFPYPHPKDNTRCK